jgi:cytochrome P450
MPYLAELFTAYVAERRREPRNDVLTSMATATFPDGSTPEILHVVWPATFLFAAGQETVTKLLSSALQTLGDQPELEPMLRGNRGLIPAFIEESMRMQSPVKVEFRLSRKTTTLGDVPIPAGTVMMLCLGAANRDPRKFDNPHEFRLDRKNQRSRAHRVRPRHPYLRARRWLAWRAWSP